MQRGYCYQTLYRMAVLQVSNTLYNIRLHKRKTTIIFKVRGFRIQSYVKRYGIFKIYLYNEKYMINSLKNTTTQIDCLGWEMYSEFNAFTYSSL